jgi:hypothetical protein
MSGYDVPAGHVVILATDEFIQGLDTKFANKELAIGEYVREEAAEGVSIEEICGNLAKGYLNHQKKAKTETSFGLIGFQVPGEVKPEARKAVTKVPKHTEQPPKLELDLSDL